MTRSIPSPEPHREASRCQCRRPRTSVAVPPDIATREPAMTAAKVRLLAGDALDVVVPLNGGESLNGHASPAERPRLESKYTRNKRTSSTNATDTLVTDLRLQPRHEAFSPTARLALRMARRFPVSVDYRIGRSSSAIAVATNSALGSRQNRARTLPPAGPGWQHDRKPGAKEQARHERYAIRRRWHGEDRSRPSAGIRCWPSPGSLDGPGARAERLRDHIAIRSRPGGRRA